MLYIYSTSDYFRWNNLKSEEEMAAIEECKNLRKLWKDDCDEYIGKNKSFITDDGKEIFADYPLSKYIERNFDEMNSKIEIPYVDKITFSDKYAKECVREALSFGEYENRIFNSDYPLEEIYSIIEEEMIGLLKQAANEFQKKVNNLNHINWN